MRTASILLLFTTAFFSEVVFGDGERDNHPEVVRRIPRDGVAVPTAREAALREGLTSLQQKITELHSKKDATAAQLLPDVMIFERAVRCAMDYNEFFSPRDIDKADKLLQEGLSRADQLLLGTAEWPGRGGLVVRGYVSRIDNTVQPYGLVVPSGYDFDNSVPTRCDVWFHGRGETLSEVNFIWDRMNNPGRYTPANTIVMHPYGRYSNAFKFAGEVDVLEGLEDVQRRYRIDEDRISVRGFSMGGAACWQFAVHYPGRWFAANPGAGFSETPEFLKFFQKETLNPKPWVKALWNMYDCNRYALNLTHCPTIAYSGEKDIQKQAADVMEAALKDHGVQLRHVIGPNMGHSIDEVSRDIIDTGMAALAKRGRNTARREIHFATQTLKYNELDWLTVDGLIEHWKAARVDAELQVTKQSSRETNMVVKVATANVSAFSLEFPPGTFSDQIEAAGGNRFTLNVRIKSLEDFSAKADAVPFSWLPLDGPFSDGSAQLAAHRQSGGKWVSGRLVDGLRKRHGLQGPVDDALMDSFVFVRPTGTAANEAVGDWAHAELERAIEHWRRQFRGDARVVRDVDVSDELIQNANLILWGDPSSNSIMKQIAARLPIEWTSEKIQLGEQLFDAKNHAPILIYPNPLNPERYVVLNSSFTYRDYAYLNNARQVPMLPDWAIVNLDTPPGNVWPGKIVAADFFGEEWQLKK